MPYPLFISVISWTNILLIFKSRLNLITYLSEFYRSTSSTFSHHYSRTSVSCFNVLLGGTGWGSGRFRKEIVGICSSICFGRHFPCLPRRVTEGCGCAASLQLTGAACYKINTTPFSPLPRVSAGGFSCRH